MRCGSLPIGASHGLDKRVHGRTPCSLTDPLFDRAVLEALNGVPLFPFI